MHEVKAIQDLLNQIFNWVNSKWTPLTRADLALAHVCSLWPEARAELRAFSARMAERGFDVDLAWQDKITKVVRRVAKDLLVNDETEVSEVSPAAPELPRRLADPARRSGRGAAAQDRWPTCSRSRTT